MEKISLDLAADVARVTKKVFLCVATFVTTVIVNCGVLLVPFLIWPDQIRWFVNTPTSYALSLLIYMVVSMEWSAHFPGIVPEYDRARSYFRPTP